MRTGTVSRDTSETSIGIRLLLDGSGNGEIATGIGFFDHMLNLFVRHGLFDMEITATGDLHVDHHHTVEDVGICVGEAFRQAVGDKKGLRRYGFASVPMDEALASVTLDFSGRPFLVYANPLDDRSAGSFALDLVPVFLQALADKAGMNLHVTVHCGRNPHHASEAVFKALGRALRQAVELDPRVVGVPSTKGVL